MGKENSTYKAVGRMFLKQSPESIQTEISAEIAKDQKNLDLLTQKMKFHETKATNLKREIEELMIRKDGKSSSAISAAS